MLNWKSFISKFEFHNWKVVVKHYSTHLLLLGGIFDIVSSMLDASGHYFVLAGIINILALLAKFIPQNLDTL